MITLTRKLKKDGSSSSPDTSKRISVRDRLLIKEVQEMEQEMEKNVCKVKFCVKRCQSLISIGNWFVLVIYPKVVFNDPNILSEFTLTIQPDEGFWKGGKFKFTIAVPEEYNMIVSLCLRLRSLRTLAFNVDFRHKAIKPSL